jgi:hypothetical protein
MQQRQLRLGDILDDYCPRERRITNHAVVAMIDQEVRQTRCTTCDSEHAYKQARLPTLRRKKDSVAVAYKEVLAAVQPDVQPDALVPPPMPGPQAEGPRPIAERLSRPVVVAPLPADPVPPPSSEPEAPAAEVVEGPRDDEGPVHRRLIRAQLPRQDAQVVRPVPQFTVREAKPGSNFKGRAANRGHAGSTAGRARGRQGSSTAGHGGFGRDAGGRAGGFSPRSSTRPADAQRHPRHPRAPHAGRPTRPAKKH